MTNLPATMSVDEAAALLGISRNLAFRTIGRDKALAGVPAIRVGRRIVLPRRAIENLVGLATVLDPESDAV